MELTTLITKEWGAINNTLFKITMVRKRGKCPTISCLSQIHNVIALAIQRKGHFTQRNLCKDFKFTKTFQ